MTVLIGWGQPRAWSHPHEPVPPGPPKRSVWIDRDLARGVPSQNGMSGGLDGTRRAQLEGHTPAQTDRDHSSWVRFRPQPSRRGLSLYWILSWRLLRATSLLRQSLPLDDD